MMLGIHGLPPNYNYHDVKMLIKEKCKLNDEFILDALVNDLDGCLKVRVGTTDDAEAEQLIKYLDRYRLPGNFVLKVIPISKLSTQNTSQPNSYGKNNYGSSKNDYVQNSGQYSNIMTHPMNHGDGRPIPHVKTRPILQKNERPNLIDPRSAPYSDGRLISQDGSFQRNNRYFPQVDERMHSWTANNNQWPSQIVQQVPQNSLHYQQQFRMPLNPNQVPIMKDNFQVPTRYNPAPIAESQHYRVLEVVQPQHWSQPTLQPYANPPQTANEKRYEDTKYLVQSDKHESNLKYQDSMSRDYKAGFQGRRISPPAKQLIQVRKLSPSGRHIPQTKSLVAHPARELPHSGGPPIIPSSRPVSPPKRHIPPSGKVVSPSGRHIPTSGRVMSPTGRRIPTSERRVSPSGRLIPTSRRVVSPPARVVSPSGRPFSTSGRDAAPSGRHIPPFGRPISPSRKQATGSHVIQPERPITTSARHITSSGRLVSPGKRISPSGRRLSTESDRKVRGPSPHKQHLSLHKRPSPSRLNRYSPSRHHIDKPADKYFDDPKPKQVRVAYEPPQAPIQAMYSGGYRPSIQEEVCYPPQDTRLTERRESPWQHEQTKMNYPMKTIENKTLNRMQIVRTDPHADSKRLSPRKSRSPGRRDRSPLRDRYKKHSPSPLSPRRSWALEKRQSPEVNEPPPPPMWPGPRRDEEINRAVRPVPEGIRPPWTPNIEKRTKSDWRSPLDDRRRLDVNSRRSDDNSFRPDDNYRSQDGNTRPSEDNNRRFDDNTRRLDDNTRRFDDNTRRLDDNTRRPDDNTRRLDDNSRRPDGNSRRPDGNSRRLYDNSRRSDGDQQRLDDNRGRPEVDLPLTTVSRRNLEVDHQHLDDDRRRILNNLGRLQGARRPEQQDRQRLEYDVKHSQDDRGQPQESRRRPGDDLEFPQDNRRHLQDNYQRVADNRQRLEVDLGRYTDNQPHLQENRRRPEDNRRRPEDEHVRPEGDPSLPQNDRRRPQDIRRRPEDFLGYSQDDQRHAQGESRRNEDHRRRLEDTRHLPEDYRQRSEEERKPLDNRRDLLETGLHLHKQRDNKRTNEGFVAPRQPEVVPIDHKYTEQAERDYRSQREPFRDEHYRGSPHREDRKLDYTNIDKNLGIYKKVPELSQRADGFRKFGEEKIDYKGDENIHEKIKLHRDQNIMNISERPQYDRNQDRDWKERHNNDLAILKKKAVEELSNKIMEKHLRAYDLNEDQICRTMDELKLSVSRNISKITFSKEVTFTEIVTKYRAKYSDEQILQEVLNCMPSTMRKLKRPIQDKSPQKVKISKLGAASIKKEERREVSGVRPAKVPRREMETKGNSLKLTKNRAPIKTGKVKPKQPIKQKASRSVHPVDIGTYELNPLMTRTVESELNNVMVKILSELPDTPTDEADKLVIETFKTRVGDELKNTLGLNVSKRLLNVFNPLIVKVKFANKPDRRDLANFLKKYNFTAFKRLEGNSTGGMYAARMKSISDYDKLCATKTVLCGNIEVEVSPCYKFLNCPSNLKTEFDHVNKEIKSTNNTENSAKAESEKNEQIIVTSEKDDKSSNIIPQEVLSDNKNKLNTSKVSSKSVNTLTDTKSENESNNKVKTINASETTTAVKTSNDIKIETTATTTISAAKKASSTSEESTTGTKVALIAATETPTAKQEAVNSIKPATGKTSSKIVIPNKVEIDAVKNTSIASKVTSAPTTKKIYDIKETQKNCIDTSSAEKTTDTIKGKTDYAGAMSKNIINPLHEMDPKKQKVENDFDELKESDILALMSEGIVLDECSGSDDE